MSAGRVRVAERRRGILAIVSSLCVVAALLVATPTPVGAVGEIFVDVDATGANDGSSWTDAYTDLNDALALAGSGDPVWVAEGTYTPDATDRANPFSLPGNARVYGGFDGTESALGQRDPVAHPTILSGDLAGDDDSGGSNAENSFTVVVASGNARLDGFIIERGNADGALGSPGSPNERIQVDGPAIFSSAASGFVLANSVIRDNAAGGSAAGAASFESGSADIVASTFDDNSTPGLGVVGAVVRVFGTVFTETGGAMLAGSDGGVTSNVTFENVTMAAPGTVNGGNLTVQNSIIWPGSTVVIAGAVYESSNIQGSGGVGSNIDVDPQFADPANGNYRLLSTSPSIDAGDDALVSADVNDADNDGDFGEDHPDRDLGDRIIGTVDHGAYEGSCPARQYVDLDAGGAGDGSSWADAHTDLQDALAVASDCQFGEIWVAEGTYLPTATSDRSVSFLLTPAAKIYGGFDGTETTLAERDPAANPTILSGDIGTAGSLADNSYHVVRSERATSDTRLDGFTVRSGRASGTGADSRGAGIQIEDGGSPRLVNLIVRSNVSNSAAGGVSLAGPGSTPFLVSSILEQNSTQGNGGNLRIGVGVAARIANTVISQGTADGGGGIYDNGSNSRFDNVTLGGNTAAVGADALQTSAASDLTFDNSIVWDVGGGFAPNGTVTYRSSNVQGSGGSGTWNSSVGTDGGGNIDADPLFAGPQDFGILGGSPSLDAGDQTLAPPDVLDVDDDGDTSELVPDVERKPRLVGPEIDQGAYETASCPAGPVYVDQASAAASPDGSAWSRAFPDLQSGLTVASGCGVEVWVAGGVYLPSTVGDATERFVVGPEVEVFGGFRGVETSPAERVLGVYPTILSGDLDGNDVPGAGVLDASRSDNSELVVELDGADTRLDGVTVTGGNSSGALGLDPTAVHVVDGPATITNVRVEESRGGDAILVGTGATATIAATAVADSDTGLTFATQSTSTVINSEFVRAGRITAVGTSVADLVNPTIVTGSVQANTGSTMTIDNAIARTVSVTDNGTLTWRDSNVEGSGGSGSWIAGFGTNGGGNIDADPLFVDAANDRYRLTAGSPSLDAGSTGAVPADGTDVDDDGDTTEPTPDLDRLERVVGAAVDHGASEGACPAVVFVDETAGGVADGSSWSNAFTDLDAALRSAALCSAEVWVAAGTYRPDGGTGDRTRTFTVESGVEVYGGFDGSETDRGQRAPGLNITTLSGDLAGDGAGNDADDSYTVLTVIDADPTTVVDGFVVTEGDSDGPSFSQQRGGGVYVDGGSPVLANLFVTLNTAENRGGGIHVRGESTATLTNIAGSDNTAAITGGGLWVGGGSSPVIANLALADNLATDGGGLALANGSALIVNATITDNTATGGGGGVYVGSGSHEIVNSIAFDNAAVVGPLDVEVGGGSVEWSSSSIEGSGGSASWNAAFGTDGGGNVDLAPQFIGPGTNNFRLSATSPLVDLGDTAALPIDTADLDRDGDTSEALPSDLQLGDRVLGVAVDMGAYEGAGSCPASGRVYVDASNTGPFTGLSWGGAFADLQNALAVAATCPGLEIWVAGGTYLPTSGTDRSVSFNVASGTRLYGGFAGTETALDERDVLANSTQLSGDLDGDEQPAANSHHVVVLDNVGASTIVDGFTVLDGNADGAGDDSKGGGLLVLDGAPLLANLTILRNQAMDGGGVAILGGTARLLRSTVRDNIGLERTGGIRIEGDAAPSLVNLEIIDNEAEFFATGLLVIGSDPNLINLTVSGNTTLDGGVNASAGIDIDEFSAATLSNVVTFGNVGPGGSRTDLKVGSTATTTSFSIIGSNSGWNTTLYGTDGGDNLFVDPQFENPTGGDYSLGGTSPAIDSGSPAPIPADGDDIDDDGDSAELLPPLRGTDRDLRTEVDRGAYEALGCPAVFYVDTDATGADDGSSWADAIPELRDALVIAANCGGSEIWVAEGTYLPTGDGDRSVSFLPIDGVGIYGGFDGAEAARADRSPVANATILSGDLSGNDAAILGGPAAADRADNSWHVVDASGLNSTAVLDGFVISGGNSDAVAGFDPGFRGGGILIDGGSPTLTGNVVTGNSARRGGGVAIRNGADPDLSGTEIDGNRVDLLGGGIVIEDASPVLDDLEVSNNISDTSSGGIHVVDGDPVLRRLSISRNEALGLTGFATGGGLGVTSDTEGSTVTVVESEIFLNQAPNGGGIAARQEGLLETLTVTVASSSIVANQATDGAGGGIYATDADLVIVSSGFAANEATGSGGAINHADGAITLVNSTIAGNETSGAVIDGVRLLGTGTVSNSIIDETSNVILSTVTTTTSLIVGSGGSGGGWTLASTDGGGNIDTDPLFVNAPGGDYHLTDASPAVDAGTNALVPADSADADDDGNTVEPAPDLDLLARIVGTAVDMGAYEFGAPPAPVGSVFTPVGSCVVGDSSSFGPLAGVSVTVFQVTGVLPVGQGAEAGSCNVPAGADAVLVNVQASGPLIEGNLRVSAEGVPASGGVVNFSALTPPLENSNAVVVPLSVLGQLQVEVNCGGSCALPTTDVRLTVLGYFDEPSGAPDEFGYVPVTPCAAFDSRTTVSAGGIYAGLYDAGEQRTFQITGAFDPDQGGGNTDCGVPTGAAAVMVNLVALNSAVSGEVAIGAGGTDPDEPVLSHAPLTPSMNNANAVIVPLDANGQLLVEAQGAAGAVDMANVRGVILGYLADPAASAEYFPVTPCAAFDSRGTQGAGAGFVGPYVDEETRTYTVAGAFSVDQGGGNTDCGVPVGADAVLLNLVAINPTLEGNLRVAATGTVATGGVVNFASLTPKMNNSNAVIVPISALGQLDVTANLGLVTGVPGVEVRGVVLGYLN